MRLKHHNLMAVILLRNEVKSSRSRTHHGLQSKIFFSPDCIGTYTSRCSASSWSRCGLPKFKQTQYTSFFQLELCKKDLKSLYEKPLNYRNLGLCLFFFVFLFFQFLFRLGWYQCQWIEHIEVIAGWPSCAKCDSSIIISWL